MSKFLKILFAIILLVLITIIAADYHISSFSSLTYNPEKISEIPSVPTALILGTSKYTIENKINRYYQYRIEAATELYKQGKWQRIIVSGDNSTDSYNEPRTFMQDLIKAGIPDSVITLDFAGFRTFDSVVRAREVFGQDSILIISQKFHNLRALFIADAKGIEAIAYNAQSVPVEFDFKTYLREKLARVKAILDIYILGTEPKFLGEKVDIQSQ